MSGPDRQPSLLDQSLDRELARLEPAVARAGMLAAMAGVVLGAAMALILWQREGTAVIALCALLLGWFGLMRWALRRERAVGFFRWGSPLVEVTFPTLLVLIEAYLVHANVAMAASVLPSLFAVAIVLQVLRLRPLLAIAVGAAAGLQYSAIIWLALAPRLEPELRETVYSSVLVAVRAGILVTGGAVAALVAAALRRAMARAHGALRARDLFGKYRLGEQLGAGGMGVVFRATYCPEGGFERPVAIKRIHEHLAQEERFVAAFRREAELCARLNHPNIVQVIDFGRIDRSYFFAMEYVDGCTLAQLLRQSARRGQLLPASLVAWVGREIGRGLEYAQGGARDTRGAALHVVHRDLSPQNVLLSRAGEVKLLDFGIAKVLDTTGATHTSTVVGKCAYMAPEQVRGEALDGRCDLFAVGIVIWEMLVGRQLFRRDTDSATYRAVQHDPVLPPSTLRADLAVAGWDAFVIRALAREPAARFQTATEMNAALDAILAAAGAPASGALGQLVDLVRQAPLPPDADTAEMSTVDERGKAATVHM